MTETLLGVEFFSVTYAFSSSLPGVKGEHHADLLVHGVGGLAKHHLMRLSDQLSSTCLCKFKEICFNAYKYDFNNCRD